MAVPRTSARWATRWVNPTTRPARSTVRSRLSPHHGNRRSYASQGPHHGSKKSGSDLPWAIGSAVVTIPSVAYLIQPQLKKGNADAHGHGNGEEAHGHGPEDKGGPVEDTEPGNLVPDLRKNDSADEGAQTDEDSSEEKGEHSSDEDSDVSGSGSDGEPQRETPDTTDNEEPQNTAHETDSGENVEGVQFKGATSGGSREGEQGDTRKHIPDAKGGNKKRIESDYGQRQGVAAEDNSEPDQSGQPTDKPAASKSPAGGMETTQSGKQEGLSNTDTKHSTDISSDPDKSKKGEGSPETAKLKGTVAPARPQAENRVGSD